jgi:hypothetical protein
MADEGWTRSYRGRWTHPVFRSLLHAGMWAWMTDTAAWRDTCVRFGTQWIKLERGQLVTSERFMAEGFEVNRIVVRRLLDTLEEAGMIARSKPQKRAQGGAHPRAQDGAQAEDQQRAQAGTIITICNYDKFQSSEEGESPPESPPESPRRAQAEPTRSPNKKEDKNLRKEESDSSEADFVEWYRAYPRRVDPGRAAKAYRVARKLASAADLLAGARRYAAECNGKDPQYIKHPASWLNAQSWMNEPAVGIGHGTTGPPRKPLGPAAGTPEFDEQRRRAGI